MNYELRGLLHAAKLLACCCLLAGAGLFAPVANAGFSGGHWETGWSTDWQTGTTQTSSRWVPPGSPATGNTRWGVSGGVPTATGHGRFPVGRDGVVIDVEAKTLPDRRSVAGAIGRLGRKLGPLGMAMAWYDFFEEIGYIMNEDGTIERSDPNICTVSPCYEFYPFEGMNGGPQQWQPSISLACQASVGRSWSGVTIASATVYGWNGCTFFRSNGTQLSTWTSGTRSVAPAADNLVPSNWEDLENSIANKTNWASDSNLPTLIKEAADSGEPIDAPDPSVTGPASKTGPTTTTQNPDGSVTTRQTTYNMTYNGDTVTYITNITTTVVNNGQTVSETTETTEGDNDPQGCDKFPDTLGCADLDLPDTEVPKTEREVTYTPDDVGLGSGSCPQPVSWTDSLGQHQISFQPVCDHVSTVIRPVVLAFALLAAFFIVAPVRND